MLVFSGVTALRLLRPIRGARTIPPLLASETRNDRFYFIFIYFILTCINSSDRLFVCFGGAGGGVASILSRRAHFVFGKTSIV